MPKIIRHGESEANVRRTFAGQKENSPLTELGRQQAKQAAVDLLKQSLKIDRVITSPLLRAQETAEILIREAGLTAKLETDSRLAEYDMGALTGTAYHHITSHELTSAEGAENPQVFQDRVNEFLKELTQRGESVLLVSHAGVGRIIETIQKNLDPRNFYDAAPLPNAKIMLISD